MGDSKIDWTEKTWNPVVGCSKVSPGCLNCYAERMARRLFGMGVEAYKDVIYWPSTTDGTKLPMQWTGETVCVDSKLTEPLHWRKPRKIFVCSMGDLFHESVPFEFIDKVFAVMALCPQHTFQVLTKRAERMAEYFKTEFSPYARAGTAFEGLYKTADGKVVQALGNYRIINSVPLPNVWLGVTAENQEMADRRIPLLLQTPAAKRFVSIEPMLGAVSLDKVSYEGKRYDCIAKSSHRLDLVICGGETGPGTRVMNLAWARMLRYDCLKAKVPFFFKNIGGVRKPKDGHLLDGVEHRPEW